MIGAWVTLGIAGTGLAVLVLRHVQRRNRPCSLDTKLLASVLDSRFVRR